MICIVQCSRKIAVFLSFMPITDLKSGGKMERMNFVRPVLNARCSCALVGHKLCFLVIFLISTATYLVIEKSVVSRELRVEGVGSSSDSISSLNYFSTSNL